jgi:hypothetical protein
MGTFLSSLFFMFSLMGTLHFFLGSSYGGGYGRNRYSGGGGGGAGYRKRGRDADEAAENGFGNGAHASVKRDEEDEVDEFGRTAKKVDSIDFLQLFVTFCYFS